MSQQYLLLRPSGYYFRFRFPSDIKALIGKTELRYSLKTGMLSEAKPLSLMIAGKIKQLIWRIRTGHTMEREEIIKIIKNYVHQQLEQDEIQRTNKSDQRTQQHTYDETKLESDQLILEATQNILSSQDHKAAPHVLKATLGIPEEKELSQEDTRQLSREFYKAFHYIHKIKKKREQGIYEDEIEQMMKTSSPSAEETQEEETGPTIIEVRELFFEEQKKTEQWTPKTEGEVKASLQILIDILGDIPVSQIDRPMMVGFKQTIMNLPPNMNKSFPDKTTQEILEMEHKKTIGTHTINKYLNRAKQLFRFAVTHGYMTMNPAEGLNMKHKVRSVDERSAFGKEDLQKIFNSEHYKEDKFTKSYQYWCPLLALFTGARQNEISQLYLEDFKTTEGGTHYIDINNDLDKHIKNQASKRIIPIHPCLVELGIMERVENLRKAGHQRFLPDLKKGASGYGHYVSRWFNDRFKKKCGITDGKKVFHSFRHTFSTNLSHNGINDHHLRSLMGHSEEGITHSTYVKKAEVRKLYDELVKHLDYGIDLSHLKGSKWCK